MVVTNPRNSDGHGDNEADEVTEAGDNDRGVVLCTVNRDEADAEEKPHRAGDRASSVYATQVLENRGNAKTEP